MRLLRISLCLLVAMVLYFGSEQPVRAEDPLTQVIILIGGVSVGDLLERDLPFIKDIVENKGASALLNSRTAGAYSPENCYASLASGARAQVPEEARYFQGIGETTSLGDGAGLWNRYYSDILPQDEADGLLAPGFLVYPGTVERSLSRLKYSADLGILAQGLSAKGLAPAIIGSGDTVEAIHRPAALLAMEPSGLVQAADFASIYRKDSSFPGGVWTEYTQLLARIKQALRAHPVIFVETGDLLRLYEESDLMSPGTIQRWKTRFMGNVDSFLQALSQELDGQAQIWLISAYPGKDAYRNGNPLTFAITWGDRVPAGFLTSATTRQPGLITNTDLVPSLLVALELKQAPTYGTPVRVSPAREGKLARLVALNQRWVRVNSARSPYLKAYVLTQILVVVFGALYFFFFRRSAAGRLWGRLLKALCIAVTLPPLLLLLAAQLTPSSSIYALAIYGLPLSIGILAVALQKESAAFALIYLGTAGLILCDTILGWGLAANSLLGYDPIGGARFYGIGNEYMGVLIGSYFMGWAQVAQSAPKKGARSIPLLSGLIGLLGLVVLGAPGWGANVGGTIGYASALTAWILFLRHSKLRVRNLFSALPLIALALTGFVIWDLYLSSQSSHLGRFVVMVADVGPSGAWEVFSRKLAMNWKLMHYTVWADGLLTFIVGLGLAFWRPKGLAKQVQDKNPRIIRGFWTSLIGALVVLIANDSGVVAAATLMIYPTFLLLALATQDEGL